MSIVFIAGPLSGLIVQPLIGRFCQFYIDIILHRLLLIKVFFLTAHTHGLVVVDHTYLLGPSFALWPCFCLDLHANSQA